jgi:hypothetical protein
MKLIGYLQGFSAMREKIEEYLPITGITHRDQIELVRARYQFQAFPQLAPGTPPPPILFFVGGKFPSDNTPFAINQLQMKEDGDVVVATTTEQADAVLEDLVHLLDENLGYRLASSNNTISHLSNLVVEFDDALENYVGKLSEIARAINDTRTGRPAFNIKRIAFGQGGITEAAADLLVAVEIADFLIERRANTPYEANRYFCSAPLSTTEHLQLLERIEAIVRVG